MKPVHNQFVLVKHRYDLSPQSKSNTEPCWNYFAIGFFVGSYGESVKPTYCLINLKNRDHFFIVELGDGRHDTFVPCKSHTQNRHDTGTEFLKRFSRVASHRHLSEYIGFLAKFRFEIAMPISLRRFEKASASSTHRNCFDSHLRRITTLL